MDGRESFEDLALHNGLSIHRMDLEAYYFDAKTRTAWVFWQAATERAAKVCDEHASIEGIAQACAAAIRGCPAIK